MMAVEDGQSHGSELRIEVTMVGGVVGIQVDAEGKRQFVGKVRAEQVSEQTRMPSRRQAADDKRTNKQQK
jgi:hypothetical protein